MSTSVREKSLVDPLIKWLQDLEKEGERGILAELRRGIALDSEQLYLLYRVVPPSFLDRRGDPPERIFMLASLFAVHPLPFRDGYPPDPRRNLGDSLRELAIRSQKGKVQGEGGALMQPEQAAERQVGSEDEVDIPEPLKRRMHAILAARSDEIFEHLRHVVRLLKSAEIPVDWDQLLRDLRSWNNPNRFVQRNWSRSFYVGSSRHNKGGHGNVS